jgi:hypothetical protein
MSQNRWTHPLMAVALSLPLLAFYPWKTPKPEVRTGEAWDGKPMRVVLLPATCASPDDACKDEFVQGLDGHVQSELEFAGYSVVRAEKLVADVRSRDESDAELKVLGVKVAEAASRTQVGSLFADLSPALQRKLVAEAGAKGVLSARIQVGAKNGMSPTRESVVMVRLGVGEDGAEVGWMARCTVKSSLNPPLAQSLDYGSKCAVEGALTGKFKGK